MTIGIGGWASRRKPMSLVRAIVRSPLKDLTIVSYGGPDIGLLCAAGKVRKAVYGFVSLDSIPLEPHFRIARQTGAVEAMELDEGMMLLGLQAAAWRVPFLPTRAGLGSDLLRVMPEIKTVRSPYPGPDGGEGEELVAMPALELDVALIHMNRADQARQRPVPRARPLHGRPDGDGGDEDVPVDRADRARPSELADEGSFHTRRISRLMVDRRGRGAERRPLHRVPARLRPRRGLPEGVRGDRRRARGVGRVPRRSTSTWRRSRLPDEAIGERGR